jgi:hypothetical protein
MSWRDMTHRIVIAYSLLSLTACAGPDKSCDAVRQDTQTAIGSLCWEDGGDYASSPFCRTCVAAGFYAISDSCGCQPLTFNADFCYSPSDSVGAGAVRSAVDQANQACPNPTLPYTDEGSSPAPSAEAGGVEAGSADAGGVEAGGNVADGAPE